MKNRNIKESDEELRKKERRMKSGEDPSAFYTSLHRSGPDIVKSHFMPKAQELMSALKKHYNARDQKRPASEIQQAANKYEQRRAGFLNDTYNYSSAVGRPHNPELHLYRSGMSVEDHIHGLANLSGIAERPSIEHSHKKTHIAAALPVDSTKEVERFVNSVRHHYKAARPEVTNTGNLALIYISLPNESESSKVTNESGQTKLPALIEDFARLTESDARLRELERRARTSNTDDDHRNYVKELARAGRAREYFEPALRDHNNALLNIQKALRDTSGNAGNYSKARETLDQSINTLRRLSHRTGHSAGQYLDPRRYSSDTNFLYTLHDIAQKEPQSNFKPYDLSNEQLKQIGQTKPAVGFNFYSEPEAMHAMQALKAHGYDPVYMRDRTFGAIHKVIARNTAL